KNAFKFPLELRARKSGDLIQPFSHKSKIKLKDYFISQKIPEHKRDEIPLLCSGKEVLWAIGIGLSEKLRANLSDTKNCKIIKYKK
ncbi:tRNA lysidine(34) synthetase TilS, partial [bacterium]|nr:tRNA lysidine(34) synthetase TilS [bacterium]